MGSVIIIKDIKSFHYFILIISTKIEKKEISPHRNFQFTLNTTTHMLFLEGTHMRKHFYIWHNMQKHCISLRADVIVTHVLETAVFSLFVLGWLAQLKLKEINPLYQKIPAPRRRYQNISLLIMTMIFLLSTDDFPHLQPCTKWRTRNILMKRRHLFASRTALPQEMQRETFQMLLVSKVAFFQPQASATCRCLWNPAGPRAGSCKEPLSSYRVKVLLQIHHLCWRELDNNIYIMGFIDIWSLKTWWGLECYRITSRVLRFIVLGSYRHPVSSDVRWMNEAIYTHGIHIISYFFVSP